MRWLTHLPQVMLATSLTLAMAACGSNDELAPGAGGGVTPTPVPTGGSGTNNPPTLGSNSIPNVVFAQGTTPPPTALRNFISDPDGDTLSFGLVSNSNPGLLTVSFDGNGIMRIIVLNSGGTGRADLIITANDGRGGTLSVNVAAVIETQNSNNTPPIVVSQLADQQYRVGDNPAAISLQGIFADPNGDPLALAVTTGDSNIAQAILSQDQSSLQLTLTGEGQTTVTVTATDPSGASISDTFTIAIVRVQAGQVSGINPGDFELPPCGGATPCRSARPINLPGQFVTSSGDTSQLIFTVSSDNTAIITAVQDTNRQAIITAVAGATIGQSANVTLTARDSDGATGTITFNVRISQNAPQFACAPAAGAITTNSRPTFLPLTCGGLAFPDGPAAEDGTTLTLQPANIPGRPRTDPVFQPNAVACRTSPTATPITTLFCDAPAPGELSFEVVSDNPAVALATVDDQNDFKVLLQRQSGDANISIFATDRDGNTVSTSFLVNNQITGQTIPVSFGSLPRIAAERDDSVQVFRIQLADFVSDANVLDSDVDLDPRLLSPTAPQPNCSAEPNGAAGTTYQYRLVLNPNTAIVTAAPTGNPNPNLGEFNITAQRVVGSTTLTFEVEDCDGDITRADLVVDVTKPDTELFVVRATDVRSERVIFRHASTPTGFGDPLASFSMDMANGVSINESGSLIQAGRRAIVDSGTTFLDERPSVRLMHNALNRAPAVSNFVVGSGTFANPIDRAFFNAADDFADQGDDFPLNPVFERVSGMTILVTREEINAGPISAPNKDRDPAYQAIRVFVTERPEQAYTAQAAIYAISLAELHDTPVLPELLNDAWDAAYSPPQDALYVTMATRGDFSAGRNGFIVRCDDFLSRIYQNIPADCRKNANQARVLLPRSACVDTNQNSTVCDRDLRGITYLETSDTLVVTDMGPRDTASDNSIGTNPFDDPRATHDNDGAVYVFHQISLSDLDAVGGVAPDLAIQNIGDVTENDSLLGNPIDVSVDGNDIIVAENVNVGGDETAGVVLRFNGLAALGAPIRGVQEAVPDTRLEVASPQAVFVNRAPRSIDDLSDLDARMQQNGIIAARNETDNVLISVTDPATGNGLVRQYALSYDAATGSPDAAPVQVSYGRPVIPAPAAPREIRYGGGFPTSAPPGAPTDISGLDITVSSEVLAALRDGVQSNNQSGGLLMFGGRTADTTGPLNTTSARSIQNSLTNESTDLISPKGIDLMQDYGMAFVADPRMRVGGGPVLVPAGGVHVFAYGRNGAVAPVFSTFLDNRQPWDLDYDPASDRLYVTTIDGSVLIFDEYLARFVSNASNRHVNANLARVVVPAQNGNRLAVNLHGIVHHRARDASGNVTHEELLLTDVGAVGSATDGAIYTMTLDNPATVAGLVNVDLAISGLITETASCDANTNAVTTDQVAMLGNPVDLAYDPLRDVVFVAEKSNALLLQMRLNRAANDNRVISFDLGCRQVLDATNTPMPLEAVQIRPNYLP